jgi:hypothetical protein
MKREFEKCPTCGEYDFVETHKCPPVWEVNIDCRDEDEWVSIYAIDEEEAAKEMAERYNSNGDYLLMGEEITVLVRKTEGMSAKKFRCSAETTIQYYANEIQE